MTTLINQVVFKALASLSQTDIEGFKTLRTLRPPYMLISRLWH
jgi:hypothetical protein